MPIDISVIVIARSSVPLMWLSRTITIAKWVTMPSSPPVTVQPLDEARVEVEAEGDVDPLRVGRRQRADRAVADLDLAAANVDAVELGAFDDDVVQLDAVRSVDLDPVLAAAHRHVADGDVVGRDQDAAADDRARLADDRLRVVEDERPLVDAGREPDGRRLDGPRGADDREQHDRQRRRRGRGRARPSSPPSSGQLSRSSGRPACASTWSTSQAPAKSATRRPERRVQLEQPRGAHRQPELEQAEREREPARLVGKQPVVEQRRRARARPRASARPARAATRRAGSGESTAATRNGSSAAASRVSIRPLSV